MVNISGAADLTSGPMLKKIILFSLPLAASSLLQLLFNAADVVVVGRFAGSTALAAVGANSALIHLMTNFFIGLSIGANVVVARCFGARDDSGVRDAVHTSVLLSLLCGVSLTVAGVLAGRTLLEWMSCPEDIIELAALYLRIYFLGMPMMMLYNFSAALLRSVGDTKRPLAALTLAGVVNVGLNLFFVIVLRMSVAGVALATIISQAVSALLVTRLLVREEGPMRLDLRALRLHRGSLRQILQIGLPAGLQSTVFSLANVVIQSSINSFGSVIVAGNSAAANIEGFVYVGMNAFAQAVTTFVSQNVGARRYENIDRVVADCLICVSVTGLILGMGASLAGAPLVGVYSSEAEVVAAGAGRLRVICSLYLICGAMDVMAGALRGLGYSTLPMVVSLLGSCAFRLVWIATIFAALHTAPVLYLCYPLSWTVTLLAHTVCFAVVRRRLIEKSRAEAAAV